MAANKGIPIGAFRIDDVEPTGPMEYYLRPAHWLDAVDLPLLARIGEPVETVHPGGDVRSACVGCPMVYDAMSGQVAPMGRRCS